MNRSSYEGSLAMATEWALGTDVAGPLEHNLEQEEKPLRKLEGLAGGSPCESLWKRLTGA